MILHGRAKFFSRQDQHGKGKNDCSRWTLRSEMLILLKLFWHQISWSVVGSHILNSLDTNRKSTCANSHSCFWSASWCCCFFFNTFTKHWLALVNSLSFLSFCTTSYIYIRILWFTQIKASWINANNRKWVCCRSPCAVLIESQIAASNQRNPWVPC